MVLSAIRQHSSAARVGCRTAPVLAGPRTLHVALAACCALALALPLAPVRADSTTATCVLSRHDHTVALEQGPCSWSQRQGNVNILFRHWAFAFPSAEDGRTYTRLNREGPEAGPVFTREGQYTLSVYWRKPARDPGGR